MSASPCLKALMRRSWQNIRNLLAPRNQTKLWRDLDAANRENDGLIGENDELHQLLEEAETELQDALDELVLAEAAATNAETAIAEREAIAIKVAKLEK